MAAHAVGLRGDRRDGHVTVAQRGIAAVRERFLTDDGLEPGTVREAILASWRRSRRLNVNAAGSELPYVKEPNLESPLALSAAPILRRLAESLGQEPVCIILTDADGVVLDRLTPDRAIGRHLDRVQLAQGFSYAEASVGTNGIGTALEGRTPTLVFGHEHYAEHLEQLACAGVPIHHPVSSTLLGVLDLTSWAHGSGNLLMALADSTAHQIEESVLLRTGQRELALLRQYRKTCQRSGGAVLALNSDLVMMNEYARRHLDPDDQAALLARTADAMGATHAMTVIADLPSGTTARMHYCPVFAETGLAGGVVRVQMTAGGGEVPSSTGLSNAPPLPGVVGTSATWQRCTQEVLSCRRDGEWLALQGEPGTGKVTLLRAVHQRHSPAGHLRVLDAAAPGNLDEWLDAVAEELTAGQGTLVLSHVDRLDPAALSTVSELLLARSERIGGSSDLWVAVTMGTGERSTDLGTQLLPHFPHTVEVPALRHHIADVHQLASHLLCAISPRLAPTLSSEAMVQLMRLTWPGNVTQLREALRWVAMHRRSGLVRVDDLPPECLAVSRRRLTPIESLARDAIVRSLIENEGSKQRAAEALGMSRATIYRKIREYGIIQPAGGRQPPSGTRPARGERDRGRTGREVICP